MEKFEEKIVDLVDIIAEPDPDLQKKPDSTPEAAPKLDSSTEIESGRLESLVRAEVERIIKSTISENIQKMIREILVQEVEKAIARELEELKRV